jgi:MOSC domain-containing protein YiiM
MDSPAYIFQINISNGGVPKSALSKAKVTSLGLVGDRQRDTVHHGGPERALLLFPLEHILALQAEGHAIFPGAIGENVTVTGLDWAQIVPGARLRLGEQVVLQVTRYAAPCSNLTEFFQGGNFNRVSQKVRPGWSRVCTQVLQVGEIRVLDRVEIVKE